MARSGVVFTKYGVVNDGSSH